MWFQQDDPLFIPLWNIEGLGLVLSSWSCHFPFWWTELTASIFRFTSMDIFLWSSLKSQVCALKSTITQTLKTKIEFSFNEIRYLYNFTSKIRMCHQSRGGQLLDVLFHTLFSNICFIDQYFATGNHILFLNSNFSLFTSKSCHLRLNHFSFLGK